MVVAGWTFLTTGTVTVVATTVPGTVTPLTFFFMGGNDLVTGASDWAARLAGPLSAWFYLAMLAIVFLVPVGVAGYRLWKGTDPLATVSLLAAGLAAFPGVLLVWLLVGLPSAVALTALALVALMVAVGRTDFAAGESPPGVRLPTVRPRRAGRRRPRRGRHGIGGRRGRRCGVRRVGPDRRPTG